MEATLPTPRHFLTSLLNTISSIPVPPPTRTSNAETPTNPLKLLPAPHRALLSTLHVLFSPPMLLQALDLLDRGLVTRLIQSPSETTQKEQQEAIEAPPQAPIHLSSPAEREETEISEGKGRGRENTVYQVRSSQPPKSRFSHARTPSLAAAGNTVYTVRLEAWNCSCAAFAFSAFPGYASGPLMEEFGGSDREWDGEWEFGGLSLDGIREGEGGVPCCKHLLACLLAEKWEAALGVYLKKRRLGREEMAGIGGES